MARYCMQFTATITGRIIVEATEPLLVGDAVEAKVRALLRSPQVLDALAPAMGDYSVGMERSYVEAVLEGG